MAIARKTYTPEFKLQAVKMITEQHLSVTEVARRLGVPAKRLHEWKKAVREHGAGAFPGAGHLPPQEDELRRLRADVKRLEMERDILKKAAAFFATQMK
jgi:transposase